MAQPGLIVSAGGHEPRLDPGAFNAPTSVIVGEVTMAAGSSLWYGAVLRADAGPIVLGEGSNVQDNRTVHGDSGFPVTVGAHVTVGRNAVPHGCTVEDEVLIGMGATFSTVPTSVPVPSSRRRPW